MAKKPQPLQFWATANPDGIEKRFMQVGNSLLMHPAILGLSHSAFRVYANMMIECGGRAEFIMPKRVYSKFVSAPTFIKAVRELVTKGFIEVTKESYEVGQISRYKFIKKWRETGQE